MHFVFSLKSHRRGRSTNRKSTGFRQEAFQGEPAQYFAEKCGQSLVALERASILIESHPQVCQSPEAFTTNRTMAICSRNYSLCCTVLSGWGIIQLVVMGLLFYYQAIAFAEDLNIEIKEKEANQTISDFWAEANEKYENTVSVRRLSDAFCTRIVDESRSTHRTLSLL